MSSSRERTLRRMLGGERGGRCHCNLQPSAIAACFAVFFICTSTGGRQQGRNLNNVWHKLFCFFFFFFACGFFPPLESPPLGLPPRRPLSPRRFESPPCLARAARRCPPPAAPLLTRPPPSREEPAPRLLPPWRPLRLLRPLPLPRPLLPAPWREDCRLLPPEPPLRWLGELLPPDDRDDMTRT